MPLRGTYSVIMPRYYFDIVDGEIVLQDPKGLELENIKGVEAKAQKILTEVAEVTFSDPDRRDVTTIVRDEAGQVVLRMRFSLVVERFSDGSTANLLQRARSSGNPLWIPLPAGHERGKSGSKESA